MEFEVACIYRMRKILYDLSSRIEKTVKNSENYENSSCDEEVSSSSKDFIENLLLFNKLVDNRMKTGPLEKLERDNYMRDSIANLKDARAEVEALRSTLEEERSRHCHVVRAIEAEISEENMLLDEMQTKHAKEIADRKEETEAEMSRIQEETSSKVKLFENEIHSRESELKDTMKENLSHERELYAKRSEAEKRYLAVLSKYDTDVGALYRTKEDLTDELNRLDDRLNDLRDRLAVQDVQYVALKNEREMAILKAFAEDLEHFEKKRAAKIIQKAWRNFYERSCLRKKKKSKKKK